MEKSLEEIKEDSYYIKEIGKVAQEIHKFLKKANKKYKVIIPVSHSHELDHSKCGNGDLGPAYGISMSPELQEFYGPSGGRRGC